MHAHVIHMSASEFTCSLESVARKFFFGIGYQQRHRLGSYRCIVKSWAQPPLISSPNSEDWPRSIFQNCMDARWPLRSTLPSRELQDPPQEARTCESADPPFAAGLRLGHREGAGGGWRGDQPRRLGESAAARVRTKTLEAR